MKLKNKPRITKKKEKEVEIIKNIFSKSDILEIYINGNSAIVVEWDGISVSKWLIDDLELLKIQPSISNIILDEQF